MEYSNLYKNDGKVCVEVSDRLGNQLFQIASALSNSKSGSKLVIRGQLNYFAEQLLNNSNIQYEKETVCHAYPNTFRGYAQDYSFIDEKLIQELFKFPYENNAQYDTVIHIRREDYVNLPKYNTLTYEYIHRILKKYGITDKITVVSTPDGLEWAKNLMLPPDTQYVSTQPLKDMQILTKAKTVICSGSSFSVMGCILNKNKDKRCIIPSPYDNLYINSESIIPPYFHIEPLNADKSIALFCFATGSYKIYFQNFIDTLHFLLPSYKKRLVLFTDGLEEFSKIKNYRGIEIDYHFYDKLGAECMMERPKIMYEYMQNSDCKYSALFNVNIVFKYNQDESFLSDSKVTCSYHFYDCLSNLNNGMPSRFTFKTHPYAHASMVFAQKEKSVELYRFIADTLDDCIAKNQIPEWHDETVLNEWICSHTEDVKMFNSSKYLTILEKPKEVRQNQI